MPVTAGPGTAFYNSCRGEYHPLLKHSQQGGAAMKNEETCCPEFTPGPWDNKIHEWKDRPFIRGRVFSLFYLPMNFGSVMRKLNAEAEKAGAGLPDWLCLSEHVSKWRMDVHLAVDREIPGSDNVKISGRMASKVYEGPYKDTGKWCGDFEAYAREKGLAVKKQYIWYTTCPKCAKKYGHNHVVIFGQI
jgi:hypothetical protein